MDETAGLENRRAFLAPWVRIPPPPPTTSHSTTNKRIEKPFKIFSGGNHNISPLYRASRSCDFVSRLAQLEPYT